MKIKPSVLWAALTMAILMCSANVAAEIKVGMITTLSGGGAGLGLDVRDGFMLAVKDSGRSDITVVIEDDQRKPDIAVQLADKMIQSEKVDVLTGIISALAGKGCDPNYFNVAWQNDNLHEAAGAYANNAGYKNSFILAPNYPAGKDALTGYKRFFEGDNAAEIYTELGQTDYASEIAQIRASGADSVFFFLPGGMGIAFLKQYKDSGVDLPLVGPAFSFDQGILQAVGDAALGVVNTSQWNKDIDNPANAAFVERFEAEYERLPSLYASQGYDTANLLISAMDKADVNDADAFRAALKAADFDSTRGAFSFGDNHHPIQSIHAREVIKEGDVYTNKLISTVLENHSDVYAAECQM